MRVGLVYDLRDDYLALGMSEEATAEFDAVETIDSLAAALTGQGASVVRVGNARSLAACLVAGERFDVVFSIAEGLGGRSREAQVPALCELFEQPYVFSDPLTMATTLDKSTAKRLVRDHGLPTAPFAVLGSSDAVGIDLGWPVFVKPLAEGTGKGCEAASKCSTPQAVRDAAAGLIARFHQPVLVESFLPGREFTVGIIGNGAQASVLAVMEILLERSADLDVYSYTNKEEFETRVAYRLVDDPEAQAAADTALAAYDALGCRDAGRVDLRSDRDGRPCFLEVNPIMGLHPTHSDLCLMATMAGVSYDTLIGAILDAACARLGLPGPRASRRVA